MAIKSLSKNHRGSSVIELSLSLIVLVPFMLGALLAIYASTTRLWLQHTVHESLICLNEERPLIECEQDLRSQLQQWIVFGKIEFLHLYQTSLGGEADVQIQLGESFPLREQQRLTADLIITSQVSL